jgi:acyl carrier protein
MLPEPYQVLQQEIVQLIKTHKNVSPNRLLAQNFDQIGFETVDIVDIILEVEKAYRVQIPDEVPLQKVGDFVHFLAAQNLPPKR